MTRKFSDGHHPGGGYNYVICDVCGCKVRQKDTVLITDKFNTLYGMVVCRDDADRTNAQSRPFSVNERIVSNPKLLRPEGTDRFVPNANDDRVPSPPKNLVTTVSYYDDKVRLTWEGSDDCGSSGILYYTVYRAEPQLAYHFFLANVASNSYIDVTSDTSSLYTYHVVAVNSFGSSVQSNTAYFPTEQVDISINYLVLSQNNYTLELSQGGFILL